MIDTASFCRTARKRVFTLVELVVAIAIVTLTLAIAVTALRGESPAQKMERSVHEISAFCARIRFRSAEEGRDWVLKFNPEERRFYATAVADDQEQEGFVPGDNSGKFLNEKNASGDEVPTLPRLDLKLDKSFTFETAEGVEGELGNGEELEVFRFFPDGGASGMRELTFRCHTLEKKYTISPLSGRLLMQKEEKE